MRPDNILRPWLVLIASALMLAMARMLPTASAADIPQQRVHFAPGATGVVIAGSIEGRDSVDYLLGAKAGQTLTVSMQTDNAQNYFNIIPPDAKDEAIYVGATGAEPNNYSGTLDLDGDWAIRVYLYRAAARRGETADYRLDISITGDPDPSVAREANAFGPRDWDARGSLDCAADGEPMETGGCPFKVVRYRMEEGATVFAVPPGQSPTPGEERILYYQQEGWSTPTDDRVSVSKDEDVWTIRVGGEVYEVFEAVVFGG